MSTYGGYLRSHLSSRLCGLGFSEGSVCANVLVAMAPLPPAVLSDVLREQGDNRSVLTRALAQPSFDDDELTTLLAFACLPTGDPLFSWGIRYASQREQVRRGLAWHPVWGQRADVREALEVYAERGESDVQVRAALCATSPRARFRAHFLALLGQAPALAGQVLDVAGAERVGTLCPTDLASLLVHRNESTRLAALNALGRVTDPERRGPDELPAMPRGLVL